MTQYGSAKPVKNNSVKNVPSEPSQTTRKKKRDEHEVIQTVSVRKWLPPWEMINQALGQR